MEHDLKDFQKLLGEARSHLTDEKLAWCVGVLRAWSDTMYDTESVSTLRATGGYQNFTDGQLEEFLAAASIISFCRWDDCREYTGRDYQLAYEHWKSNS